MLGRNQIFTEWRCELGSIKGAEGGGSCTRDQAYLRYLHFVHTVVTGSRFFNETAEGGRMPTDDEIIAACIAEAYELVGAVEEIPEMESYNFM